MTKGAKVLIWLVLGVVCVLVSLLGYGLHLSTALQRFAKETNRTPEDYAFSLVWMQPSDGGMSYPTMLAVPREGEPASLEVRTRWHWSVSNPDEPCVPDEHRLVWRIRKDAWEMVEDLGKDLSIPLFAEDEEAS